MEKRKFLPLPGLRQAGISRGSIPDEVTGVKMSQLVLKLKRGEIMNRQYNHPVDIQKPHKVGSYGPMLSQSVYTLKCESVYRNQWSAWHYSL
jgi:hypothetical protein